MPTQTKKSAQTKTSSSAKTFAKELVKNTPKTDSSVSEELNYCRNFTPAYKFSSTWAVNIKSAMKALREAKVAEFEDTFFNVLKEKTNSQAQIVHLIGVAAFLPEEELLQLGFTKSLIAFLTSEKLVTKLTEERKSLKSWTLAKEVSDYKKKSFKTENLVRAVITLDGQK